MHLKEEAQHPDTVNLNENDHVDIPEDDDLLLAACQEWESAESETSTHTEEASSSSNRKQAWNSMTRLNGSSHNIQRQRMNPPQQFPPLPPPAATPVEELPGFDPSTGDIWIYPTNYPVREYQFNIAQQALFKNTMVTLPTGLGKTFIAAVVMYNFYRWYPQGKVVFMAPTKPLVAQQIEACYNVMGIPQTHMSEMTGHMQPATRKICWAEKRVFFLTPQVLMNDISRLACPAKEIKCLVVDEAHKALGNHAYCQVVTELSKYSQQFRVLALSATPGGDLKAVQQVLHNMKVAHIEIRSEDSIDIKQYAHERKVEKVVVPLGEELKFIRDQYLQILIKYTQRLNRCGVLYKKDPANLTKFEILRMRDAFRQDPPQQVTNAGAVEGDFALCISLYHGYELLLQHGMRSLYNFLQSTVDTAKGLSRTKQELLRNGDFQNLMEILQDKFPNSRADCSLNSSSSNLNSSRLFSSPGKSTQRVPSQPSPFVMSHPKMAKLQDVVVEHFKNFKTSPHADGNQASTSKASTSTAGVVDKTRVMIFGQYRDSVQEIAEMLNRHRPLIRCMSFIGQSSAGKSKKGFTQKEQLRVVREFREGGYNTLVSTCVGEEGLDIGDVDLIVCYDAHKSPIRLVQRMGRTGRKRQGRIVMLVTEGKEAAVYDRSQYNKKGIHRALQGNSKSLQLYANSPRMVPKGLHPTPHKMHITIATAFKTKSNQKKGSGGGGGRRQSNGGIMNYVKPSKPADRCFLTSEELAQWSALYQIHGEEADHIPRIPEGGHFVSLKGSSATQKSKNEDSASLSLNQWSLWQSKRQPIVHVDHSDRTKNFVELMQFIELQGQIDEEDDPYGMEMQTYLDEEDINKPKKKNEDIGIRRFCQKPGDRQRKVSPIEDSDSDDDIITVKEASKSTTGVQGKEQKREATENIGKHRRKRRTLEAFSEDEKNSSDEDLPDVNLDGNAVHRSQSPVFNEGKSTNDESKQSDAKSEKGKSSSSVHSRVDKKKKQASKFEVDSNSKDELSEDRTKDKTKSKMNKIKMTRPRPMMIESSDDDDFEDNPQARKKVTKSPVRTVLSNLAQDDELADDEKSKDEDDSVEAMDTGDDTVPSSPDESISSSVHSPVQKDDNDDHQKDDGSYMKAHTPGWSNLDGSKLNLTANLSTFFPNCSQVATTAKSDKQSLPAANVRTTIPPPPPSVASLDLLDDLSLNTTPEMDFLVAPVLRVKIVSKSSKDEVGDSEQQKYAADEADDVEIAPKPLDSLSEDGKSNRTKPRSSTFSVGEVSKLDKDMMMPESGTHVNLKQHENSDSSPSEQSRGTDVAGAKDSSNIEKSRDSSNDIKQTTNVDNSEKSCHTKISDEKDHEELNISFTLGDDLFEDLEPFEEPAEELPEDSKPEANPPDNDIPPKLDSMLSNSVNNSSSVFRKKYVCDNDLMSANESNLFANTVDCTFDPAPFDFQTPKMCNKTITGKTTISSEKILNAEEDDKLSTPRDDKVGIQSKLFEKKKTIGNKSIAVSDEKFLAVMPNVSKLAFGQTSIVKPERNIDEDIAHQSVSSKSKHCTNLLLEKSQQDQEQCSEIHSRNTNELHSININEDHTRNTNEVHSRNTNEVHSRNTNEVHSRNTDEEHSRNTNEVHSRNTNEVHLRNANEALSRNTNRVQPQKADDMRSENNEKSAAPNIDSKRDDEEEELVPQFDLGFDLDPQFDLDFDLDNLDESDFEEIDIVPPSPTAVRQQEFLSQRTRDSINLTSSRTFSTSALQLGKDDLENRPSSSTPLHGSYANKLTNKFTSVGAEFMSPITSKPINKDNLQQITTDIDSFSAVSNLEESSVDTGSKNGHRSSAFCRVRPLFKAEGSFSKCQSEDFNAKVGDRTRKSPNTSADEKMKCSPPCRAPSDMQSEPAAGIKRRSLPSSGTSCQEGVPSIGGKRKSSSPLAPCGMRGNELKRRKSSLGGAEAGHDNNDDRTVGEICGGEEKIDLSTLAELMDGVEDFHDDDGNDFQAAENLNHTSLTSKVTPKKDDSDSDDELVPAFRKRKKSTALPSPTTPTFKTPGKPPRKLSRLSRLSTTSQKNTQCNIAMNADIPTSSETTSKKESEGVDADAIHSRGSDTMTFSNQPKNSTCMLALSEDRPFSKRTFTADSPELSKGRITPKSSPSPPQAREVVAIDSDSDDDDNDIVPGVRKRRKARVLQSPLSQVIRSPCGLLQRAENRLKVNRDSTKRITNISSDEDTESPLIRRPKKSSSKPLIPRTLLDDDDDDDFTDESFTKLLSKVEKKSSSSSDDNRKNHGRTRDKHKNAKKKSRSTNMDVTSEMVRGFLDEDAEVSDDDRCSSDESGSDLDDSLDGFIASQQSQMVNQSDMHAIYMRSVRSPEMNNRFKMVRGRNHNMDIFSQVPVQDESYYEDSFVVEGGDEHVVMTTSHHDDSLLENTINMDNIVSGRRTRKRATTSKAEKILRQGRRRVLRSTSSSDDDVMEVVDVKKSSVRSRPVSGRTNSRALAESVINSGGQAEQSKERHSKGSDLTGSSKPALRTNLSLMNNKAKLGAKQDEEFAKPNFSLGSSTLNLKPARQDNPHLSRTSSSSDASEAADAITIQERQRLERLRRQREQQRLFRLKMEEKKKQEEQNMSCGSTHVPSVQQGSRPPVNVMGGLDARLKPDKAMSHVGVTKPLQTSTVNPMHPQKTAVVGNILGSSAPGFLHGQGRSNGNASSVGHQKMASVPSSSSATLTSPLKGSQKKVTVLIDSKELASSSHIVSTLTLQYDLNAVVGQLAGCDFIVSNRMGVEKKTWSDFANGANKTKLVDRMRHLCQLFDRPCLIIEKDRVKSRDEKKPKKLVRTKYLDSTLANLAMTHIKVLYSESVDDTARILSELAKAESAKGMAITSIPEMDQATEQVFKFYQSLPRVSYPLALSLLANFSSIQEVITSSASLLQKKGQMSEQRAKELYQFLRHRFDKQMTGGGGKR